ncbi:hypothetical protein AB6A40_007402 [Gnathostoma spinigerum]|uniref:Uncharacterized protein n=1 Tax=Gnathostoma spinigerum TaxID=75299 RepID=A0ABD6EL41_9BILA
MIDSVETDDPQFVGCLALIVQYPFTNFVAILFVSFLKVLLLQRVKTEANVGQIAKMYVEYGEMVSHRISHIESAISTTIYLMSKFA